MKGFFDHNIEPHVARAIHAAVSPLGNSACALRDKFDKRASDIEWLTALGKEGGWTVFSSDRRILTNPIERRAFYDAGLTAFFLKPAVQKQTALERTATILWHWKRLSTFTAMQERGAYWLPVNKATRFVQIRL